MKSVITSTEEDIFIICSIVCLVVCWFVSRITQKPQQGFFAKNLGGGCVPAKSKRWAYALVRFRHKIILIWSLQTRLEMAQLSVKNI